MLLRITEILKPARRHQSPCRRWSRARSALLLGLGCLVLAGCAGTPSPTEVMNPDVRSAPQKRRLEVDEKLTSASGATLTVSKGWFATEAADVVLLEDPDGEITLGYVEVTADDGPQATAMAWARIQPGFDRAVIKTDAPPPPDGWDEYFQHGYETQPSEKGFIDAYAYRKGSTWYVITFHGTYAALSRRRGQVLQTIRGLRVPGVEKESFVGRRAEILSGERLAGFESFIDTARERLDIPGAAVAIIQEGKVISLRGYGVIESGKSEAVTADTLFMIGSVTKAFTSLFVARLIDEGKATWETPVTTILPQFALADEELTKQVTLETTLCACLGLPRSDVELVFEYATLTPDHIIGGMKTLSSTAGISETYQYSNLMIALGGYAAATAFSPGVDMGVAYATQMQAKVFEPLGMSASTVDFAAAVAAGHATPHGRMLDGTYRPIPLSIEKALIAFGPAGAGWSTARDMARYVVAELSGQSQDGSVFPSEASSKIRKSPGVRVDEKTRYGLGLYVTDESGVAVLGHSGDTFGFTSDMFFLPEHQAGVVILANARGASRFRKTIKRRFLELIFRGREEAMAYLDYHLVKAAEEARPPFEEATASASGEWTGPIMGAYESPTLGSARLVQDGDRIRFDVGEWKSAITRETSPTGAVKITLTEPPLAGLELDLGEENGEPTLSFDAGQFRHTFRRVGP